MSKPVGYFLGIVASLITIFAFVSGKTTFSEIFGPNMGSVFQGDTTITPPSDSIAPYSSVDSTATNGTANMSPIPQQTQQADNTNASTKEKKRSTFVKVLFFLWFVLRLVILFGGSIFIIFVGIGEWDLFPAVGVLFALVVFTILMVIIFPYFFISDWILSFFS